MIIAAATPIGFSIFIALVVLFVALALASYFASEMEEQDKRKGKRNKRK